MFEDEIAIKRGCFIAAPRDGRHILCDITLDNGPHFSYKPTNHSSPKRTLPGDAGGQGRGGSRGRSCQLRSRAAPGRCARPAR
jgi:hypothetical protein